MPLNTRQPSKQQAGLVRIIYKKEEKDKKEDKKKDEKKSKKDDKKDDKREDKKIELMRKTGMSPKMAQQAVRSPDHLSPKSACPCLSRCLSAHAPFLT